MEDAEAKEQQKEAQSFRWALATWLLWLWRGDTLTLAAEEKRELWRRLTGGLLAGDVVCVSYLTLGLPLCSP
jgi:ribosomal biogenesis protein LAS1